MRSLRTAARTVVLVTLTGAAPGCGYDNPGFKLKDSDPESDSAAQTTSVSGVTMMTTTETSPTTSTSTSTAEPVTTQGPGVSGSETSTSTGLDPTTETGEGTSTGDLLPWDASCDPNKLQPAEPVPAAADGFFLLQGEGAGGNNCIIFGDDGMDTKCVDRNAGMASALPLVSYEGDPMQLKDDLVNVFGARFDVPVIEYKGEVVPPAAFATAVFSVTVFRTTEALPELDVFPMGPGNPWTEGTNKEPKPCMAGEPTYRCRACSEPPDPESCGEPWAYGTVFNPNHPMGEMIGTMSTNVQPNTQGLAKLELMSPGQVVRAFQGLVVSAQPDLVAGDKFQVKTRDNSATTAPTLSIMFCPNPNNE